MEETPIHQQAKRKPNTPNGVKRRQKGAKRRFLEALEQFPIIQGACKQAGISRATFYRWFQDDPQFERDVRTYIKIGTESVNDLAESQLIRHLKEGSLPAIKYWLGHRHSGFKEETPRTNEVRNSAKTEQEQAEATSEIIQGVARSMKMGLPVLMQYLVKKEELEKLSGKKAPPLSIDPDPHPDDASP
jgi:hypothetical protein